MDGSQEKEQGSGYTVVGVVNDGPELNQAVAELKELGVGDEDLTAVIKRRDTDQPEPFPEGTRYIVVPDDSRGLEVSVGFAVVFVVIALLFAFTTPVIGAILFVFFISLAAVLAAGSLTRVGADPILINMDVPAEESNSWNEEFEEGKALVFANTSQRSLLRTIWEVFQRQGADFYIAEQRLEPQPVSGATLHRIGAGGKERGGVEYIAEGEEDREQKWL